MDGQDRVMGRWLGDYLDAAVTIGPGIDCPRASGPTVVGYDPADPLYECIIVAHPHANGVVHVEAVRTEPR